MKIELVCFAGMSTSLLVNKIKDYANKIGESIDIGACPVTELADHLEGTDIVLLGPQVAFQKSDVEKLCGGKIPVMVIDTRDYGMMRGESVYEKAKEYYNSYNNK